MPQSSVDGLPGNRATEQLCAHEVAKSPEAKLPCVAKKALELCRKCRRQLTTLGSKEEQGRHAFLVQQRKIIGPIG